MKLAERHRLVEEHQWLVQMWARKYSTACDYDDLVQEGNIGLLRAAEKYRPNSGVAFRTYAAFWLKAVMGRLHQRQPLVRHRTGPLTMLSLDEPLPGGEHEDATFLDVLEDHTAGPEDLVEISQLRIDVQEAIAKAERHLNGIRLDIVRTRLMQGADGDTLEEVGRRWGVSRERVRQVELKTRKTLKRQLSRVLEAHGVGA